MSVYKCNQKKRGSKSCWMLLWHNFGKHLKKSGEKGKI